MMKVLLFLWIICCAVTGLLAQPLPAKLTHPIIIDTDCAIDDMRAISILLSRPEINIYAIITSDGSLSPNEGYEKVKSLLGSYNRNDIPVAAGNKSEGINPPWRKFNQQLQWADGSNSDNLKANNAVACLIPILENTGEKITWVCLGTLTNVSDLLKADKSLIGKIERIIWYNDAARPLKGFNYECDTAGANNVFRSSCRVDVISNLHKENALFGHSLVLKSRSSETKLASVLYYVYSQPSVIEKLNQDHFRLCDDLAALYVTNPELFDMNTLLANVKVRYNQDYNTTGVLEALSDMIGGTYVAEHNVVFNRFPDQRELFNYDVRSIMDSAIARYGRDEWKACVMTDEFHGHLGVFSIVGAKMGIMAREYFGVQLDMLKVVSFAGSVPPYSCMNDGIQVSTGATLGMGTIKLANDSIRIPSAIFTYGNRSVTITLKLKYLEQVESDINEGIVKYGLMDDGYWKLVRRNALKYWVEWDRKEIFELDEKN